MGEHHIPRKLGKVPGHRATPVRSKERMLHLSKELHMRPTFGLGVDKDGKQAPVQTGWEYVLKRGDGKTYRKPVTV